VTATTAITGQRGRTATVIYFGGCPVIRSVRIPCNGQVAGSNPAGGSHLNSKNLPSLRAETGRECLTGWLRSRLNGEDDVHDAGALLYGWPDLLPVDGFRHLSVGVADQPGDVLQRDVVGGGQRNEAVS
jgi:hypothetical protein